MAALENRRKLAERTRDLAEKGFFSQQALDNAETDVQTQERCGEGDSHDAELPQCWWRRSRAWSPCATSDTGALVTNATSNQTSAQPVVTISDTSKLRVTVYVDQVDAGFVKPGTKVEITDSSNPSIKGEATVSRISGELDGKTRTMATQVDFDNRKGTFIAGSFVNVSVLIPSKSYIEAPAPHFGHARWQVLRRGNRRRQASQADADGGGGHRWQGHPHRQRHRRRRASSAESSEHGVGWCENQSRTACAGCGRQRCIVAYPITASATAVCHTNKAGGTNSLIEGGCTATSRRYLRRGYNRHMSDAETPRSHHDMGGLPAGPVEPTEHDYALWEKRVDALLVLLSRKNLRLMTVDELRKNIEALGPDAYDRMSYYERWIHSVTQTLIQRGVITIDELGRKMTEIEQRHNNEPRSGT